MIELYFTFMGTLGAVLYVLTWSRDWGDVVRFESVRHVAIGAIIGYVYFVLHSEHNFPNSIMAMVAGYMGSDFVQSLVERFRVLVFGQRLRRAR